MRRRLMYLFTALGVLLCSSPVFAQTAGGAVDYTTLKMGGIAMAIVGGLCGIGMGMGLKGTQEALARNPGAAGLIRVTFFIGFAFIESLALYALVIVFLKY